MQRTSLGCLLKDINWSAKGLDATNLKLLNYELGYFNEAKQVLTHCWASLNLLAGFQYDY